MGTAVLYHKPVVVLTTKFLYAFKEALCYPKVGLYAILSSSFTAAIFTTKYWAYSDLSCHVSHLYN